MTKDHTLVITKRHVPSVFELGAAETKACMLMVAERQKAIRESDASVLGFNLGANDGEEAGQTVPHCHWHLIPRQKVMLPTLGVESEA